VTRARRSRARCRTADFLIRSDAPRRGCSACPPRACLRSGHQSRNRRYVRFFKPRRHLSLLCVILSTLGRGRCGDGGPRRARTVVLPGCPRGLASTGPSVRHVATECRRSRNSPVLRAAIGWGTGLSLAAGQVPRPARCVPCGGLRREPAAGQIFPWLSGPGLSRQLKRNTSPRLEPRSTQM